MINDNEKLDLYGQTIDQMFGGTERRASLASQAGSPDEAAARQRLSRETGLPSRVVELDPVRAKRESARIELDKFASASPLVSGWLEGDSERYAVAKDDLKELGYFAGQYQRYKKREFGDTQRNNVGAIFRDVIGSNIEGTGRLISGQGRSMQEEKFGDSGDEEDAGASFFGTLFEGAGEGIVQPVGDTIQSWGTWIKPPKERETFVDQVNSGLVQVASQVAAPGLAVPSMYAQGANIAGERAEEAGATQKQIDTATEQGALVTGVSEKVFGVVGKFGLDKLPGVKQLVEKFGHGISGRLATGATGIVDEGGQEVLEGIGHDVVAQQYDPNTKIGEGIVQDFSVAGTVGFITRAALHANPRVRRIEESTESANWLEQVHQAVQATKTAKRNPQVFESLTSTLVAQGGPANAFIGAEDFVGLYQDGLDEARSAAAELTGHEDALSEALAANGDLQIPMARYMAFIATDRGEQAKQVTKLDPDHLTVSETLKLDLTKEANDIATEMFSMVKADMAALPIDQQVYGELVATGRYNPGDAETMAKLLPRFYSVIANSTGRTVEAVQAEYPVKTISDTLGDQLRRRDPNAESLAITPVLDAIRENKIPSMRDAYGPSLLEFLVSEGGVQDFKGELATMDARIARPGLVSNNGLTLDEALAKAREAGYFPDADPESPDTLEINDLLEAIRGEISGNPVHLATPSDTDKADLRMIAQQWQEALPELIADDETMDDLLRMSNQQILKRARERLAEGYEQSSVDIFETPEFKRWFGDKTIEELESDYAKLTDKKGENATDDGHRIDTDLVRELSPDYRADRSLSQDMHPYASALTKRFFANALARPVREGKSPTVAFLGGGGGSGKSTASRLVMDDINPDITFDGTLSKFENAKRDVDASLASGRSVKVVFVYRSPLNSVEGAIKRAIKAGRPVPAWALADAHHGAPQTAKALEKEYNDNSQVDVIAIYNDGEPAQRYEIPVKEVPDVNRDEAEQIFRAAIESAREAGELSPSLYASFASARPLGEQTSSGAKQADPRDDAGNPLTKNSDPADGGVSASGDNTLEQPADGDGKKPPRGKIQFPKFGIGDGQTVIRIGETADQSTFLHEMGHFFLEVLSGEAAKADAPAAISKHFDTFLNWFGVSAEQWRKMSLDEKRPYHEQFARGFERYLGEGKAPSHGLRSAFRSFKRWVVSVYRDLTKLNVELSDDVRDAFDRLLASDDEIDAVANEQQFEPALTVKDAQRLGLSDSFIGKYSQTLEKAKESLTAKVLNAKAREAKSWYRDQVKAERERVKAEAEAMPVYQTIKAMRGGVKLDKAALVRLVGEGSLPRFRGMYAIDGGTHPELVSEGLGWSSPKEMVEAIMNAVPLKEFVDGEASARVRERHGDPMTDGTINDEAQVALHNSRMMGALQAELVALGTLANMPPPKAQALSMAAEQIISQRTSRELNPHQYLVAERKAANAAAKAAAKGNYAEAFIAKRQQALNAALYSKARDTQSKVDRFVKHAKALDRGPAQKRLAAAGGDYLTHINGLLGTYEFRPLSGKALKRRMNLRTWVESLQDDGELTSVSPELLARVEAERIVNWQDVPVAEVLSLKEAVKNIEHLASLKNKLLAGARKATKEQAIAEIVARIDQAIPENLPDVVSDRDKTALQTAGDKVRGTFDSITRPETIIEWLDGGQSGPMHDFIWAPQIRAEEKKIGYMKSIGHNLKGLHATLPDGFMSGLQTSVSFKGITMSRFTLVSAALNLGNDGNRQRLRDGGISTTSGKKLRLGEMDMAELANLLTADEARYVQGLWDVLETLRPDISALHKRMSAVPVEFVKATPISLLSADGHKIELRGGYWPLAYHFDRSAVGERQADGDALKALQQVGSARAVTSKGHTKARVEELSAPLQLDFGHVLSRALDQVMTDLSYRESVRDTSMLLRDPRIKAAIIQKLGEGALESINGGITYSVAGGADVAGMVAHGWRKGADFILANLSVSALAIRPDIALGNYAAALVQAQTRLGRRATLIGLGALYGNRVETTTKIRELSIFMDNRLGEFDHQYQQAINTANGKRGFRAAYFRMMMTLHRFADAEASQALWWGSYYQARQTGTDSIEAVRMADKLIRQTQTATGRKDLSTFERDPSFAQSKQFMGPMFVQFARLAEVARGKGEASTIGNRLSIYMWAGMVGPAMFMLAAGRAPDDEDDDGQWSVNEWARWAAINIGLYPLQAMPLVREVEASIEAALTNRPVNPRGAPTAQAAANIVKAFKSMGKNWNDENGLDYWDMTRDLSTVGGAVAGMPASQISKTSKAVEAVVSDDRERGAMELSEMALYGKPVYTAPEP